MSVTVERLLRAHRRGDEGSLKALAVALAASVRPVPPVAGDPAQVWADVDTRGAEQPGTWQEVRAARDYGDLTDAEYEYLAAAVDALTIEEDTDGHE